MFKGRFMGKDVAVKRLDGYGLQGLPNFLREVQVRLVVTWHGMAGMRSDLDMWWRFFRIGPIVVVHRSVLHMVQ